ncbi:MAG: hypothetical protein ACK53L_34070, partial [Pirellulaceae bacterium]
MRLVRLTTLPASPGISTNHCTIFLRKAGIQSRLPTAWPARQAWLVTVLPNVRSSTALPVADPSLREHRGRVTMGLAGERRPSPAVGHASARYVCLEDSFEEGWMMELS